jgi:general stress protein 26
MKQRDSDHIRQITKELRAAGMTPYGFIKIETDHLPDIIHPDEHVKGVVYGWMEKSIDSVMLVATNRRIIFIDCKPFYQDWDEISYEVVAGVEVSFVGPFAGVVLHTRVKDYRLRFVNINCAKKFEKYIETHIESLYENGHAIKEKGKEDSGNISPTKSGIKDIESVREVSEEEPNTAVLSTTGPKGAHGVVVHYVNDKDENFYVLTKTETFKAQNILKDNRVALTIHQTNSLKYISVLGTAEIEEDSSISSMIFSVVTAPKKYLQGTKMPPITKIKKGNYIVLKITPTAVRSVDYSTSSW